MDIDAHTNLDKILKSEDVINIFMTAADSVRKDCTFPRVNYLRDEMNKSAIRDAQIDGEKLLYSGGSQVKSSYDDFHLALYELQTSIESKAVKKEQDELNELISAVTTYLSTLQSEYDSIIRKMESEEDPVELQRLEQSAYRKKTRIGTYEAKKNSAVTRLKALGGTYEEPSAPTSSDTGTPPPSNMVTVTDESTKTTMEYDENNPGVRTITYSDYDDNQYTATYSYDDQGRPVCTITDANGTTTTYATGEDGYVTKNGEQTQNGERFTYFTVEDAATGSTVEVPVLVSDNFMQPCVASGYGMGNGDQAYVTQVFFNNITGDRFGGTLSDPTKTNTKYDVTDANGTVTQTVYYSAYQTKPYGYQESDEQ